MILDLAIPPRPRTRRGPKLHTKKARVKVTAAMGRKTQSRFALMPLAGRVAKMPPFDSGAIVEGRTVYPSTVLDPEGMRVLKSGANQAKLGGIVLRSKWAGMPIYALTLEERATCPEDCVLWRACYGNGMHLAQRFEHGPALEEELRAEVAWLAREHPGGFVVRLHTLGDFYSVAYVELWAELLELHPELQIFGYTARWRRHDLIAQALLMLASTSWERFAIRFSNAPVETCSTITIEHAAQCPPDALICPEQLGQTESCSTCGLCWQTNRRIAFIRH